jgi:hypothetical protein
MEFSQSSGGGRGGYAGRRGCDGRRSGQAG